MADDTGLKCWAYGTVITKEIESIRTICDDLKAHAGDGAFDHEFEVLTARIRDVDDLIGSAKDTCALPAWVLNGWMQLKKHYAKGKTDKFYEDIDMFSSVLGAETSKNLPSK